MNLKNFTFQSEENNMSIGFDDLMGFGLSVDAVAETLNENIKNLPVGGVFKIRIKNKVSDEDKYQMESMLQLLAEQMGRSDITFIIEGEGDLN